MVKENFIYVGIDLHKETHTAVMIDCYNQKLGEITFPNRPADFPKLVTKVKKCNTDAKEVVYGLENAYGYGRPLAVWLIDICPFLAMKYMELIAPCHFGMEAVLKREILDLGYEISKVEDGKVTFLADAEGIAQANMFLRTTERILLKTGEFKAVTFDELFEKTKAILLYRL